MKNTATLLRTAILALSASVVLPTAPVFGQETAAPPPVVTLSPPPPVISAPPPAAAAPAVPTPRINVVPQTATPRAAPAPTARAAPRTVARTRVAAPARTPVRAPAPAPAPAADPIAAAPAPVAAPPPVAELPAAAPVETAPVPVETPAASDNSTMYWLIGGGALLLAALAFFALRGRRGRADEGVYEETVYEAPVVEAAPEPSFVRAAAIEPTPATVAPVAAAAAAAPAIAEETSVEDADQSDVDALAADSAPVSGRPWLEFLMRPVRAGTSQDDTIVQFELTVGNTGTVAAKDVRISTWMFAGNEGSEMERSLITPPPGAIVSEVDIEAGDGTRVDGEISMPKSDRDTVLPVVHADARYRLPDGTEGRTSASFSVGLPDGDGISPFQLDRATGLIETVEARLYGEPERV